MYFILLHMKPHHNASQRGRGRQCCYFISNVRYRGSNLPQIRLCARSINLLKPTYLPGVLSSIVAMKIKQDYVSLRHYITADKITQLMKPFTSLMWYSLTFITHQSTTFNDKNTTEQNRKSKFWKSVRLHRLYGARSHQIPISNWQL